MMNEKQICAGNIRDITFMCRPAMLPMLKRGHKLHFRELFRNTNFCIQFMWQKGSTFLAIVTPSYRFAPAIGLPKRSFVF
jgi:hypothetical protein